MDNGGNKLFQERAVVFHVHGRGGGVDIGQFQIGFRNEIGGAAEPSGKETLHSQIVSGAGPERLVDFVGSGSCFRVFFNDVAVGNHAAG